MLDQLSVFVANQKGRVARVCRVLADTDINMHSLFVADTEDFGVVRIFCDTPFAAAAALKEAGFRASVTKVIGVCLPNEPDSLAKMLEFLDAQDVNVQYLYCFLSDAQSAIDVLKVDDAGVEDLLAGAGYQIVAPEDIYQMD